MGTIGVPGIREDNVLTVGYADPLVEGGVRWQEINMDWTRYSIVAQICIGLKRGIPKDVSGKQADFSGFPDDVGDPDIIKFHNGSVWDRNEGFKLIVKAE